MRLVSKSVSMNCYRFKSRMQYGWHARYYKGHGVHSPFVYHLVTDIIEGTYPYYCFDEIEDIRLTLKPKLRRHCLPKEIAQVFFRMINFFQPKYVVEFGHGDGITAQYLTQASSKAKSVYMEDIHEVELHDLIQKCSPDLVIFYADLDAAALRMTLRESLAAHHEDSIFVVAGIHDTPEKNQVWKNLLEDASVTLSLDLFSWGMIFFRKTLEKRTYILKY